LLDDSDKNELSKELIMRRLLIPLAILVFVSLLSADPLFEDFSSASFPPTGWTVGPNPWYRDTSAGYYYSAPASARTGNVNWTEYWLISPRLSPSPGANILTFWRRDHEAGYIWDHQDEYTYVMVSTLTNNYLHFTDLVWTGGYQDFGLAWQQTQIDLSAYNGQNIYVGFKHISTGGNFRYIDDVAGINLAVVPPEDPAGFSATAVGADQVQLAWLTNAANDAVMLAYNTESAIGTPLDNHVYHAGDTLPGGGTVLYLGADTQFLHTGLNSASGYFYRAWSVNEIAENIFHSLGVSKQAMTGGPVSQYPWQDGFEVANTDAAAVAGWTQQSSSGSGFWKANTSVTTVVRSPRSGLWNAYLTQGNSDWLFKELQVQANTVYTVGLWAKQDGYNINNAGIQISRGSSASAAAMLSPIVPSTGIQRAAYQELTGSFTADADGSCWLGIRGYVSSPSNYLSIDDISISDQAELGIPILAISRADSPETVLLSWSAVPGAQWYAVYAADDPAAQFGPGLSDPVQVVTGGTSWEVSAADYGRRFYLVTSGEGDLP